MSKLSSLAAVGAAAFVFTGISAAQTAPNDYDFNWAPMSNAPAVGLSGPFLFSFGGATPVHFPGPGDAIRRCYSVDITQGGKNQTGSYETTWFTFAQGFAATNPIPGVDVGLLSIQSATDSDLGGDACLSPWFSTLGNTGGHSLSVAFIPGLQGGTAGAPFPSVWQSVFQWAGSGTAFTGVPGSNVIGVDGLGLPLLANVIYEIQGPLNAGSGNNQYYLGTTDENTGLGATSTIPGRGTGGVTNGNSLWGTTIFGGATPDVTGAVSHSRIFGFDPIGGGLTGGTAFWGPTVGSAEVNGFLAFSTPFLWAENNGSIGSGGADWNIGSGTPSSVQVWLKDITSGGQGNGDVLWKTGGGGAPSASFDPTLLFNYGFFFWSFTPAVTMQQLPMSWDDLGGAAPPAPGSYILGSTTTAREGSQTIPANFDALMGALLSLPGLTNGTTFTGADSVWYDAGPGGLQAIWEGMFDAVESGLSKLSVAGGAAFPVSPVADPTLAGVNAGIAALTIQVRLDPVTGVKVDIAEVANGLTVTLQ